MSAQLLKQSDDYLSRFLSGNANSAVIAFGAWILRLYHFYTQFRLRYKLMHPQPLNALGCDPYGHKRTTN